MKNLSLVFGIIILLLVSSCSTEKYRVKHKTDANGYAYEYVTNDPLETRIYTLENGLKIYMSRNEDEPRISTLIAVRAGSAQDPVETTGLAHYFEHMMFKGTDEVATKNWEKEKVLLDQITELFEQHKAETDPEKARTIYRKIDSVSVLAAGYALANEYDKMVSSIGAKMTNAGTSYDLTVYMNDIPKNEFNKWIDLEYERFSDMILRLFHTELETVYEEFNMYQDMDNSRADAVMMKALFPNHPYGRDVIGLPEHLKKPSVKNIYQFAETFYVPNNIAIILSGDVDFETMVRKIDDTFGKLESRDLPEIEQPVEEPVEGPVEKVVTGPSAANVAIAFRFNGGDSEDSKYVTLIDNILSNSRAGLMDLNLVQTQKVLAARSGASFLNDYGIHTLMGVPREGQTLEEVKELMLAELDKIKEGAFEEWMIEAVVNNFKLQELRRQENNMGRSFMYMDVFIKDKSYAKRLRMLDEMAKITKEQIMDFAKERYGHNYVVVYKKTGPNDELVKVEKPEITAIEINREDQSEFYANFAARQADQLEPRFVNFEEAIDFSKLDNGLQFDYVENPANELFQLYFILDMGKRNDLKLPLAVNYLPYLGTDTYSPAEFQQELYKLALSTGVRTDEDRTIIFLSGLEDNLEEGLKLFEHLLSDVVPDQEAYDNYVDGILKSRADAKLNQNTILFSAMLNYGKYGPVSPFTHIIPEEELRNIKPGDLTDMIHNLTDYEHKIFYYGRMEPEKVKSLLEHYHQLPGQMKKIPERKEYTEIEVEKNKVYIVDYDMVQANILMVARDVKLDMSLLPPATLFNEYFGSGLSSIVFQEIREARALAYRAFASFDIPYRQDESIFVNAFVGTQADKLKIATDAMLDLMNNMPRAEKQFSLAKESIIKKIETERITRENIYYTYLDNLDRGVDYDVRKDVYESMKTMTLDELEAFFNGHIAGKNYTFLILGKKGNLNMKVLKELGEVKELTLDEIFNY
ncbi:MAG: insulinase family protein [Bacteroidales bacterium]|nr:insulinase family protein [Bacteroidales bacterium]MBN2698584.1 insulinase family protein [Bacteroidales bacterium]